MISLDSKILVLKADDEKELNDFIELAEQKEKEKKDKAEIERESIDERIKKLSPEAQSIIGVFEKCPNLDKKEIRKERLKERYGINIGIN
jgi:DNA-directed RNA polymerase sigma subunit (sigma70/sigma32)